MNEILNPDKLFWCGKKKKNEVKIEFVWVWVLIQMQGAIM